MASAPQSLTNSVKPSPDNAIEPGERSGVPSATISAIRACVSRTMPLSARDIQTQPATAARTRMAPMVAATLTAPRRNAVRSRAESICDPRSRHHASISAGYAKTLKM